MKITRALYEQLVRFAAEALPYEACGFVTGSDNHSIQRLWPLKNEWQSPRKFFVSKKVVSEALKNISLMDHKVLGIYHSHPTTAPIPSSYDLANHADDEVKMIIISFKSTPPSVKCYTVSSHTYDEHPFFIE